MFPRKISPPWDLYDFERLKNVRSNINVESNFEVIFYIFYSLKIRVLLTNFPDESSIFPQRGGLRFPNGAVATPPPPPLSPPLNLGSCQTYAKITRAQRFFMHLSTQEKLNTEHGCEGRSQHCTDPKPNLAIKFTEIYGIHNTIFALSCSKMLEFVIISWRKTTCTYLNLS